MNMKEFVKDSVNKNLNMRYVLEKYNIKEEDWLEKYIEAKQYISEQELDAIMREVYYNAKPL